MESPSVRLRLVFDRTVLSKTLKEEGLKRCWVLLKPQHHKSISDLSSYLIAAFHLHHACPSGLLLTMEGFRLPSFESTSIFRDNDVVRVKRKETDMMMEVIEAENNMNQPVGASAGLKLLANEEFGKESGGYECESEEEADEDASSEGREEDALPFSVVDAPQVTAGDSKKKRKASKELNGVRKKKKKRGDAQNGTVAPGDVGKNAVGKQKGNLSSVKVDERSNKKHNLSANGTESSPQENGSRTPGEDASDIAGETKKLPSRSARRKKAKRRWLRELKAQTKESDQSHVLQQNGCDSCKNDRPVERLHQKVPTKLPNGSDKPEKGTQQLDEDSEAEDDVVPVMIKPGHIRFQSLRTCTLGAEQTAQKDDLSVGNFQWNGTTSKKKGQKWGTEKAGYSKMEYDRSFNEEHIRAQTTEEEKPKPDHIDFDKLDFYVTLPKVGDVIAYRLIELSPSWVPEISSYRVGKISEYDMETNKIFLVPVSQYPIHKKMVDIDGDGVLTETSSYGEDYNEDGSLEISYASLVEVRLVNRGKENPAQPVPCGGNEVLAIEGEAEPTWKCENHNGIASSTQEENRKLNTLEELQQIVERKKHELMHEDDRNQPENSRKRSWSHRALRSSALGPTMALLRSENVE